MPLVQLSLTNQLQKATESESALQERNYEQIAKLLSEGNLNEKQLLNLREIIDNQLNQLSPTSNLFACTTNIEQADRAAKANAKPVEAETSSNLSKITDLNQINQAQADSPDNFVNKWKSLISAANINMPELKTIAESDESFKNGYLCIVDFAKNHQIFRGEQVNQHLTMLRLISMLSILIEEPLPSNDIEGIAGFFYLNRISDTLSTKYPTIDRDLVQKFISSFLAKEEKIKSLSVDAQKNLIIYLQNLKLENNILQILNQFANFPSKDLIAVKFMILKFNFKMKEGKSSIPMIDNYEKDHPYEIWKTSEWILTNKCFEELRSLCSHGSKTYIQITLDENLPPYKLKVSQGLANLLGRLTKIEASMKNAANDSKLMNKAQDEESKLREPQKIVHVKMTADQIFKIVEDATSKHRKNK